MRRPHPVLFQASPSPHIPAPEPFLPPTPRAKEHLLGLFLAVPRLAKGCPCHHSCPQAMASLACMPPQDAAELAD